MKQQNDPFNQAPESQQPMPPAPQGPPIPQKKKKNHTWLWIALGIFVGLPLLSVIIFPDATQEDKSKKESTEATKQDSIAPQKDLVKAQQLESKFSKHIDDFENITWIEPKSKPKYINTTGIYSYFAIKDSIPENMRFVIQYGAENWLFIDSYTFLIDGKKYEFTNPHVKRDNNSQIWEWSDTPVMSDKELLVIYAKLLDAKEAKIRFNGQQYSDDYTIPESALKSLRETKDFYIALGGK